ncbi:phosphoserine phosphatase SerB [Jannaschia pagri]|uniref:Phosphoserine phosphatase n=1 Tax=Jannaschia pagri TaxID=2829797 RepID=A0ABQ4NQE5_9RHOB|nr:MULTISPECIES: phosphoserine phosphatase SerB [unclassified Jannaschia]GIT92802.1 phosphoserine phosphatase SerB [Jannaschia sp. AI_61]GIT96637.1 phosphoserine phosphatase SerB [Jannaschia sp. AI_62]
MYVCVLTASPAAATLEIPMIEALRNAWGGGDATWLAPGIAAEFPLDRLPDTLDGARADLDAMGVDVNVVPVEGRRKRLLLADMDSTMIQQECIDELAAEAGVGDRVAAITAKAMNGEIDFEGALRERVGLLAGLDVSVIDRVIADRITLMPGGPELVATMKANGARAALVSGGFTAFTSVIAARLGFDENRANTLLEADGKLTGEPGTPILGREAKVTALEEITAQMGITDADVLAVGDGANDLGMLTRAGMGVALHAKPAVQAEAGLRVNHGDLTTLLYLQGYHVDAFVHP